MSSQLGRYYDWLGRFQGVARWLSGSGDQTLTLHRRLRSERPDVTSHAVVHERLLSAIGPIRDPRAIDAGCGLGGTVFFLPEHLGGRHDGITLSQNQRARAGREARRRRVAGACRFHVRSYDDPLTDLVPDGADLIVAIESLAHARDPVRAIANLAGSLRPGGRLAVVDDVPADALTDDDSDFVAFREGWRCPRIARSAGLASAFGDAGLDVEHDEDLTPLVVPRDPDRRERLVRVNRRLRRLLGATALGELVDSLYAGLMLERLYARGLMRYRMLVACRPPRGAQPE